MKFRRLALVCGVEIYAPDSGYISFFSSPYTPHLKGAAVDISNSLDFGDEALSPVSGIVERIVEVECLAGPYEKKDYMIAIRPRTSTRYRIKLMHIKPSVNIGERIEVGDTIGRYIRTNYFAYHHIPHVHVEVCRDSTLRPSKSLEMKLDYQFIRTECIEKQYEHQQNFIELKITHVGNGFIMCEALNNTNNLGVLGKTSTGELVVVNGELGVGLGHIGLIHLGKKPKPNSRLILASSPIGYVKRIRKWYSLAIPEYRIKFQEWLINKLSTANLLPGAREFIGMSNVRVEVDADELELVGVELLISYKAQVKLILRTKYRSLKHALDAIHKLRLHIKAQT